MPRDRATGQETRSRPRSSDKWPEWERPDVPARLAEIEAREAEQAKAYQTLLGFARSGAYRRRAAARR